jgi:hypothetical protein
MPADGNQVRSLMHRKFSMVSLRMRAMGTLKGKIKTHAS